MLIGLISDTHIRIPGHRAGLSSLTAEELPSEVKVAFTGVDLILHAGDIYTLPVLDDLETVAPVRKPPELEEAPLVEEASSVETPDDEIDDAAIEELTERERPERRHRRESRRRRQTDEPSRGMPVDF